MCVFGGTSAKPLQFYRVNFNFHRVSGTLVFRYNICKRYCNIPALQPGTRCFGYFDEQVQQTFLRQSITITHRSHTQTPTTTMVSISSTFAKSFFPVIRRQGDERLFYAFKFGAASVAHDTMELLYQTIKRNRVKWQAKEENRAITKAFSFEATAKWSIKDSLHSVYGQT